MPIKNISESEARAFIDQIWEVYDEDGNGYLDPAEFRALLEDLFNAAGQSLNENHVIQLMGCVGADKSKIVLKKDLFYLFYSDQDIYD